MVETKENRKSIRLTDEVCGYIEGYRGESFNDRLANLVLDYMGRYDQLIRERDLVQAQIRDKRDEMRREQLKLQKVRMVNVRLGPLVDAVEDLLQLKGEESV